MTWKTWCYSNYNTKAYYICDICKCVHSNTRSVIAVAHYNSTIVADRNYSTERANCEE